MSHDSPICYNEYELVRREWYFVVQRGTEGVEQTGVVRVVLCSPGGMLCTAELYFVIICGTA